MSTIKVKDGTEIYFKDFVPDVRRSARGRPSLLGRSAGIRSKLDSGMAENEAVAGAVVIDMHREDSK